MKEVSFIDFRTYASAKLNKIKENFQNHYAQYVMENFACLSESVNKDILNKAAEFNNLQGYIILKDATYNFKDYAYFIYDDMTCIGLDNKGKIVYIDNYDKEKLNDGKLFESTKNESIKKQIKSIKEEITKLQHEANKMSYGTGSYWSTIDHINNLKKRIVQLANKMD